MTASTPQLNAKAPFYLGRKVRFAVLLPALALLRGASAWAHPMDLGQLDLVTTDDRVVVTLKLHELAAERFLSAIPRNPALDDASALFHATLESSVPKMNDLACQYLSPGLVKNDPYLDLKVVMTCPRSMNGAKHLSMNLPFLAHASNAFELMAKFAADERSIIVVANRKQPYVEFGENSRTFTGFVKMGMCHIGACTSEWQNQDKRFQFAEGLDHIFFIIALVLAGGGLWGLVKVATGFTLGHSITLALSTYKVIHIHSKWIEVGIAFSIAYVAARAFFAKGSRAESWVVASLFGLIHGLGFSGALQDLELKSGEVLNALVGFNLGVEFGQIFFMCLFVSALWLLHRASSRFEKRIRQAVSLAVCFTGIYWMFYRGLV